MCTHRNTYIHTYIHTYTHSYTHTSTHTHAHTHARTCTYANAHTYTLLAHTHTHAHSHSHFLSLFPVLHLSLFVFLSPLFSFVSLFLSLFPFFPLPLFFSLSIFFSLALSRSLSLSVSLSLSLSLCLSYSLSFSLSLRRASLLPHTHAHTRPHHTAHNTTIRDLQTAGKMRHCRASRTLLRMLQCVLRGNRVLCHFLCSKDMRLRSFLPPTLIFNKRKRRLRIFGPELSNQLIKTARSAVSKLRVECRYIYRQPRNFENITLVERGREHFRRFQAIFFAAEGKNSLLQRNESRLASSNKR